MPDDLAAAIAAALTEYTEEVTEGMKKAVDTTADEVNAEIKRHIKFQKRTGKYVKAFAVKTSFEDKRNKRKTWYVKAPEFRKTHLLENGHKNRNGTRARAYPHIKYGEELAQKRLPELVEDAAQGK